MNYYRKPINKVVDDVELRMQLGALTLKISENNNKIDSLLTVDKNIIKDVSSNLEKIDNIKEFLIYSEDFKKLLILKNKYLDLIKLHIFILFLKKRLHMISLKIVYYS